MGYLTVLLALLMLDGARANAHALPGPEREGTVESVRAYLDTLEHAGISGTVLVEFQGSLVISQGYGYSDLLQRRKNSPRPDGSKRSKNHASPYSSKSRSAASPWLGASKKVLSFGFFPSPGCLLSKLFAYPRAG